MFWKSLEIESRVIRTKKRYEKKLLELKLLLMDLLIQKELDIFSCQMMIKLNFQSKREISYLVTLIVQFIYEKLQ